MKFKKLLTYSSLALFLISCDEKKPGSFNFRYSQSKVDDYTGQAFYTDEYFKKDSSEYNPSLATTSLCLAMSSFGSNSVTEYTHKYCNVESFFKTIGFTDIDANEYYKTKPTADSLGVCIAQKKIDGQTLIAVGVRGGNYEMEWASNFTLGDGKERSQHEGFYEASSIYLNSLRDYLRTFNITGSIKLWSVGYSRGGATNNLAAARIDQRIHENKPIFDELDVTIKKEDLYAYCFEPPQGASWKESISPRDEIYSNIHNIVNSNDPVPLVAMSKFRFTRYGVDYYLPDSVRNSDYNKFSSKMLDFYNHIDNRLALGDYLISDFSMRGNREEVLGISEATYVRKNWTSGLFLEELLNNLTEIGVESLENYVTNLQDGFRTICEIVFKNSETKFSFMNLGVSIARTLVNDSNIDIVVNNLLHDISAFETDLLYALRVSFNSMGIVTDPSEIVNAAESLVVALAKTLLSHIDYFFTFLSVDNVKSLAQGHYPEVCLSNLMALDINYNNSVSTYHNDGSYYYLEVPIASENLNVVVKNKDGKSVASLENGSLLAKGSLAHASMDGMFICYVPVDEEYSITIENAAEYNLSYFDQKYENKVQYKHEQIENGKKIEIRTTTYPEKQSKSN